MARPRVSWSLAAKRGKAHRAERECRPGYYAMPKNSTASGRLLARSSNNHPVADRLLSRDVAAAVMVFRHQKLRLDDRPLSNCTNTRL